MNTNPARPHMQHQCCKYVLALVLYGAMHAPSASALGSLVDVEVVDRTDGRLLQVYQKDGQHWIVGAPGHEYLVRIRNLSGARVLTVASVDGVNVISGDTAAPAQSGYVLDAHANVDIAGWRTSLARTASFYFTELEDAYATRTGRPDNVGVIGVAVFRERSIRISREPWRSPRASTMNKDNAQGGAIDADRPPKALARADPRDESAARTIAPASPAPSLGTGYGRAEEAPAQRVRFERESTSPAEVITVRYDRRENLIAMGVLSSPIASPRPFPGWTQGFVPAPPAW